MAYNVLIVDDSATMRALIRKVLTIAGFDLGECLEAGNGREALAHLEDYWVDLVLSDLHMPEMNGLQLVEAMRRHHLWQQIPVVLITTESRQEIMAPLLAGGGIQGYIRKPFRPEDIREKLHTVLGEAWLPDARQFEGCDF